jgi:EAL domain-containing protein (putative c-di-GMP-specific phosphodiesterase class I)/GGDEF domain-containing protein
MGGNPRFDSLILSFATFFFRGGLNVVDTLVDITSLTHNGMQGAEAQSGHRDDRDLGFDLLRACAFRIYGDKVKWVSPEQAATLLRLPPHKLPQDWTDWQSYCEDEDKASLKCARTALTWEGAKSTLSFSSHRSDESRRNLEMTLLCQSADAVGDNHIFGVLRDVTKDREHLEKAVKFSDSDPVTGLPNKKAFLESVNHLSMIAHRLKTQGYLFRLHLKNLETIQTVYGYETCDRVLCAFADRLKIIIDTPDCAGRASEGDFLIGVLGIGGVDGDPAVLGKRLKLALSERAFVTPQGKIKLHLEVSYTSFPQAKRSLDTLLAQTSRALQVSDDAPVAAYKPIMGLQKNIEPQGLRAVDITAALDNDRIVLAYQPIVSAQDGTLSHYECLLRLKRSTGEVESAGRFIMAAEKLRLVHLLDRRAFDIAKTRLIADPTLRVSLNVSAETVKDKKAATSYLEALKALGKPTKRITLELTETAALNDPSLAAQFANEARSLGCDFAIDDFGSGHTSFRNLMAIEAETIKIDGSHIKGISTQSHMQTFVRMMVDLAQTFSVKTVAEMVEDPADAALLRRLGVDHFQGYLFGMPMSEPSYSSPK